MAKAKIIHQWTDGSATLMQVDTLADGPDSLDECVRRVSVLWHVCIGEPDDEDAEVE